MLAQEVPPSLGPVRERLSRLLRLFYDSRDSALNLIPFPSLSLVSGLWDIHRVFTLSSTAPALAMPSVTSALALSVQAKSLVISKPSPSSPEIIDIRGEHVEFNLKEEVISSFNPDEGPRTLPTLLLYNERGLQLFEEVWPSHRQVPLPHGSFLHR